MYKRPRKKQTVEHKSNCFICGIGLNKTNRTIEHIIPLSIYYTNKLIIKNICKKCNNKLGRICEQPAIPYIKEIIGELILKGYPLKLGRRNRNRRYIREAKALSFLPIEKKTEIVPCVMDIDLEEKKRIISYHPEWFKRPDLDLSQNFPETWSIIFPARDEEGMKELSLLSFKIIFDLCYFLWNDVFSRTNSFKFLKKIIMTGHFDFSRTEILDPDIPLLNWEDYLEDISLNKTCKNILQQKERNQPIKSPFDNPPHITFAIIKPENVKWIALLNFYGLIEFSTLIFKNDDEMDQILEQSKGIITIIEQIGKKKLKSYTLSQYEEIFQNK
ncbi:MAG: HNH endonuclease [Promethearchaeota archaeon]